MDNINQLFRNIAEILNCSEEAVKNQISEIIETALEENDPILIERQTKIISEGKEPTAENFIRDLIETIKNEEFSSNKNS